MTGQLADFLSAHSVAVADALDSQLEGLNEASGRGPRQFLNAVLVALSAEDMRPLLRFFELDSDKTPGLEQRIILALSALDLVRAKTLEVAASSGLDQPSQLALASAAAEDVAQITQRVSALTVERLANRLSTAASSSGGGSASLSITMHELRRPLTILNSYGQLLSAGMLGKMPESAMVAIEGITASTEMMVRMVNALAELSRLEDPDDHLVLESISLQELAGGAIESVSMEAKLRGCNIDHELQTEAAIRGDKRKLTLALTNILGNAVKHSPSGGVIHVRGWTAGRDMHIAVRDEGPGFEPADAQRIFEKYYRSQEERKRKVPGSGLGLYIVKTVAERHHGTVVARSKPGEGAEFEFIIPMEQPET